MTTDDATAASAAPDGSPDNLVPYAGMAEPRGAAHATLPTPPVLSSLQRDRRELPQGLRFRIDRDAGRFESRHAEDRLDAVRTEDHAARGDLSHELDDGGAELELARRPVGELAGDLADGFDAGGPQLLRGRD